MGRRRQRSTRVSKHTLMEHVLKSGHKSGLELLVEKFDTVDATLDPSVEALEPVGRVRSLLRVTRRMW